MSKRKPVEPAPGPLEDYTARFDDLFANRAQRQGFRRYLEALLLPDERNKTLIPPWPTPSRWPEPSTKRSRASAVVAHGVWMGSGGGENRRRGWS